MKLITAGKYLFLFVGYRENQERQLLLVHDFYMSKIAPKPGVAEERLSVTYRIFPNPISVPCSELHSCMFSNWIPESIDFWTIKQNTSRKVDH